MDSPNEQQLVKDPLVRDEVRALRDDFKDFTKEMRAILRSIADPITGYVPRSEVDAKFRAVADNARFTITACIAISGVIATAVSVLWKH